MHRRLQSLRLSPPIQNLYGSLHVLQQIHCKVDKRGEKLADSKGSYGECFWLNQGWGQHLLTNTRILDSIVRKSNIRPTDTVLVIGPGTGNLTIKLLEVARRVVAIEIDKRMAEALCKRVTTCGLEDRLTLIREDVLKTDLPDFDLVVANIPYGISSPLIAKLVFGVRSFRSATLLLQKEFARHLMANPGDSEFNRLAVNVKLVADVEIIMDVSKREFHPSPTVDSSVIIIHPKTQVPNMDLNEWLAFTRVCFSKKNKTLGATFKQKKLIEVISLTNNVMDLRGHKADVITSNFEVDYIEKDDEDASAAASRKSSTSPSLDVGLGLFREKVIEILRSNGYEDKRPSKLSIEELLHLLSMFNQQDIHFHRGTN